MKNTNNASQPGKLGNRSFRRLVKQLISGWIKYWNCHCDEDLKAHSAHLQEADDLIDIIAREVARQRKRLDAIGKAVGCGNQQFDE